MSKHTDSTRRDFIKASTATAGAAAISFPTVTFGKPNSAKLKIGSVSYTHLTLPTICSV